MENEECRGCRTYNPGDITLFASAFPEGNKHCILGVPPHLSETKHCPCLTCLVKSMCGTMCQDLKDYIRIVKYKEEIDEK